MRAWSIAGKSSASFIAAVQALEDDGRYKTIDEQASFTLAPVH